MTKPTADTESRAPAPAAAAHNETAVLAGGCFWGMEDILRKVPGVIDTEVGYAGGSTASPTYEAVKTGTTGHAEALRVVFDPSKLSYEELLEKWFFRMHDPTTLNRQGNDVGTQYRSAIYAHSDEQLAAALASRDAYAKALADAGRGAITTEIRLAPPFYYAEPYHQQYLSKNPAGYCGLGGTGVRCPG